MRNSKPLLQKLALNLQAPFRLIPAVVLSLALQLPLMAENASLSLVDLEGSCQDFVLETKRIYIPGYPEAFNPSLIRWNGLLLMSFRIIPDLKNTYCSKLGLIWLDNNCCPIGEPQLLNTQLSPTTPSRTDDGRLIALGDDIYLVYSDNTDPQISRGGFRVYIAKLQFDGADFSLDPPVRLSRFEGENPLVREKNWVPFIYEDQLLLAYSLVPHLIFYPHLDEGRCETIAQSLNNCPWDWGPLRGGTPALKIDSQYLAFFHSSLDMPTLHSNGKSICHYFMGAYTFSPTYPFEITQISPEPIIGKGFYKGPIYKPYWKPVQCVYPGGFVFDEKFIWIAYGRQDREAWIVKLDKQGLLNSLKPLRNSSPSNTSCQKESDQNAEEVDRSAG